MNVALNDHERIYLITLLKRARDGAEEDMKPEIQRLIDKVAVPSEAMT